MWGYSSSPLVVDDKVIVFAGGEGDRNLLAYRTDSGEPAWAAPAGHDSYSSPQLATVGGRRQCLLLGDHGLTAVDPATGNALWQYGWVMEGAPRTVQAHVLDSSRVVAGTLGGPGVALVDVTHEGGQWKVAEVWSTAQMKPEFPDFVVHRGHAYGFDGAIFCCLDLASGKRRWKEGRYGRGQVMLLPEQSLLLVISEKGEALLLAADPERHRELGRFPALAGKTWNHPVIAHGRLFVRNAEEMACYQLAGFGQKGQGR
jgi:outer membrane protein assembly factor BamB